MIDNKDYRIGILTFHAAHNFGSVLQAYATQSFFQNIGFDTELINYRLPNQKEYYNKLYSFRFGMKRGIEKLLFCFDSDARKKSSLKFECFIKKHLVLTKQEYNSFSELTELRDQYDILVSGSDQVWNINCKAEFMTEPADSILGYYLAFADANKTKKISFSSSIGGMTVEQMKQYLPYLREYSFISVREQDTAVYLKEALGRPVETFMDPTLLVDPEEWNSLICDSDFQDKGYIFVYTLKRVRDANKLIKEIAQLGRTLNKKVLVCAPFSKIVVHGIEQCVDMGPCDFILAIKNASLVITDSFHGTAFSIIQQTPFFSLVRRTDKRSFQLLERLGLQDRLVSSLTEISQRIQDKCDFQKTAELLRTEQAKAKEYTLNAIRGK